MNSEKLKIEILNPPLSDPKSKSSDSGLKSLDWTTKITSNLKQSFLIILILWLILVNHASGWIYEKSGEQSQWSTDQKFRFMSDPSLDIDFKNGTPRGWIVIFWKKNNDNSRPRYSTHAILAPNKSFHQGGSNDSLLDHQFDHDQSAVGTLVGMIQF